jgi:hypothetical protein
MFNLSEFQDTDSATVTIKHPATGAPTEATVTIAGPEHPKRKAIVFDKQRKMRRQLTKTGKLEFTDPEEEELEETSLLAACTLAWSGVGVGGKEVPFSKEAAEKLYADPALRWFRAQVKAAMDERELFIKPSGTN